MYADSIAVFDRRIHWKPNTPPAPYPASSSHAMHKNDVDFSSQNKPYQSRVLVPNNHKRPDFLELHQQQPGNQTPPRPLRKSARVLRAWRSSNAIQPVISRNNSPPSTRPKSMKNLDSSSKTSKNNMNKQKSCEEDRRMIPGYVASSSENISRFSDQVNDNKGKNTKDFRVTVASATAGRNEASSGDNTIRKDRIALGGDHSSRRRSPKGQQNLTSGSGSAAKYNLDAKTMKSYKQAFRIFDRNGDGCITTEELATVMQFLGFKPTDDELGSMVKEADEDGNGTIEFEEFVKMMRRHVEKKQKQHHQGTIDDLCDAFY
uniref:EF-hand domain-containing protein n=1 Tax=Romanomermis culicivorax TaxID=13658 RepID=A0A915I995_ROMCU